MTGVLDETHDHRRVAWIDSADGHPDFPIQNLPLGLFSVDGDQPRPGMAIGDKVLDLKAAAQLGLLPSACVEALAADTLNRLLALPSGARLALRRKVSDLLSDLRQRDTVTPLLQESSRCSMHLPARIGDYTDFYVGVHHAENVGRLFRPDNPLLPNYKHVPIGYHGRASSIRLSGAPVRRPLGQFKAADASGPEFSQTRRLDYELELGVWIGEANLLGHPVPIGQARDHIAGLCLLNDWSARDIQAWEYQPLGPFLAKNFHTSVSPWIVTTEALAPFWTSALPRPVGDPRPLPYLWHDDDQGAGGLSIGLEVWISTASMRATGAPPHRLSQGASAPAMYWTLAQIIAHHTSNGCDLQPGDLLGTGTLSGADKSAYGSLLELTRGGAEPTVLPNGERRAFLEDGDEVTITGRAEAPGAVSIGLGRCTAKILPSVQSLGG